MAEWTRDAREYLEGYLLQTAALARSQHDDVDEVVDELRNHILIETEKEAGAVVSLEQLRKVLAVLGTPEQVYGQAMTLEGTPKTGMSDREVHGLPEIAPVIPSSIGANISTQASQSAPKKTSHGCFAAIILASMAVIMVVAAIAGLFYFRYMSFMDAKTHSEEAKAVDDMRFIGKAEEVYFRDMVAKGKVGEYATIAQLIEGGYVSNDIEQELIRPGYLIELRTGHGKAFASAKHPSPPATATTDKVVDEDQTPHYRCITRFNKDRLPKSKDLYLDETGTITLLDEDPAKQNIP